MKVNIGCKDEIFKPVHSSLTSYNSKTRGEVVKMKILKQSKNKKSYFDGQDPWKSVLSPPMSRIFLSYQFYFPLDVSYFINKKFFSRRKGFCNKVSKSGEWKTRAFFHLQTLFISACSIFCKDEWVKSKISFRKKKKKIERAGEMNS